MQRSVFIILWVLLFFLHAACAIFLISSARLHWYLEKPGLSYFADLLAPSEDRHLRLFGTLLGIIGGCHALEWLRLVAVTIQAHRLATPTSESIVVFIRWLERYAMEPICHRTRKLLVAPKEARSKSKRSQRRLSSGLISASELLSIRSSRFESVFVFREAIVILAQIYQCNLSSSQIAHPWINHLSVALVVTNCLYVAILYTRLRLNPRSFRSVSAELSSTRNAPHIYIRLLCHVLDGIITFALSVVLPTTTFMHYLADYDAEAMDFSVELLYNETEFPNLVRESQALFAMSLINGFYRLIPHVSLYVCLLVIASVMREKNLSTASNMSVTIVYIQGGDGISPRYAINSNQIASSFRQDAPNGIPSAEQMNGPQAANSFSSRLLQSAIPLTFVLVAIAIVIFHIRAMLTNAAGRHCITNSTGSASVSDMCPQPVYRWFSTGASCSVIMYNCYRHGVDTSPPDVFDVFEPSVVSSIIFMHCPGLVVPSSIQKFTNLHSFEIFNSTLVEWSADAALTNEFHPNMGYLALALVNMTELPPGILQVPFPQHLHDIEISRTNLTALPAYLPAVWNVVEIFYLEHSHFTEVPRELLALPALSTLSYVGNGITKLPDDLAEALPGYFYFVLSLGYNPLTSLPATLRPDLSFGFLSLEHTNVSELPDWVFDQVYLQLYLYGSPICSIPTENPVIEAGCAVRNRYGDGGFPFVFVSSRREL